MYTCPNIPREHIFTIKWSEDGKLERHPNNPDFKSIFFIICDFCAAIGNFQNPSKVERANDENQACCFKEGFHFCLTLQLSCAQFLQGVPLRVVVHPGYIARTDGLRPSRCVTRENTPGDDPPASPIRPPLSKRLNLLVHQTAGSACGTVGTDSLRPRHCPSRPSLSLPSLPPHHLAEHAYISAAVSRAMRSDRNSRGAASRPRRPASARASGRARASRQAAVRPAASSGS